MKTTSKPVSRPFRSFSGAWRVVPVLGAAAFIAAYDAGRTMTVEQAIEYALHGESP